VLKGFDELKQLNSENEQKRANYRNNLNEFLKEKTPLEGLMYLEEQRIMLEDKIVDAGLAKDGDGRKHFTACLEEIIIPMINIWEQKLQNEKRWKNELLANPVSIQFNFRGNTFNSRKSNFNSRRCHFEN
jgi:hypothetical protein